MGRREKSKVTFGQQAEWNCHLLSGDRREVQSKWWLLRTRSLHVKGGGAWDHGWEVKSWPFSAMQVSVWEKSKVAWPAGGVAVSYTRGKGGR